MLTTKVLYQTVTNSVPFGDKPEYCAAADKELNEHLADGWQILHIGIASSPEDYPARIVTLSREILP